MLLTPESALSTTAKLLECPIPDANSEGEYVFELADDMRLGLLPIPDGSGIVVWSEVAAAQAGEAKEETEKRAIEFLRIHLARLRGCGEATATCSPDGAFLLFMRLSPRTEREWLEKAAALLNETDVLRNYMGKRGSYIAADGFVPTFP